MFDPMLRAEHALREHVQFQRNRLEAFDASLGEHNVYWYISYTGEDGGKWRVWSSRHDVEMKGAELELTVNEVIEATNRKRSIDTLRAMIAPPSTENNDNG